MSLNDKLNAVKEEFARTAPTESLKIVGRAVGGLIESGAMDNVVKEGSTMPPFELTDSKDQLVSSADLLSRGPLVVHFYRGVW